MNVLAEPTVLQLASKRLGEKANAFGPLLKQASSVPAA
jgi:hypothetical protein